MRTVGKTALAAAGLAILATLAVAQTEAPSPTKAQKEAAKAQVAKRVGHARQPRSPEVVGTITYDTGVNSAGFATQGPGEVVGNRFNSAMGAPLLAAGSVTGFTFFPQGAFGANAFFTIFGPPDTMGVAALLSSFGIPAASIMDSQFNAFTLMTGVSVGADFLAGMYHSTTTEKVGQDNMSVAPQGFNEFEINTNFPGAGTGFMTVPARNALVRVSGDVLTPVELMDFQVQ